MKQLRYYQNIHIEMLRFKLTYLYTYHELCYENTCLSIYIYIYAFMFTSIFSQYCNIRMKIFDIYYIYI